MKRNSIVILIKNLFDQLKHLFAYIQRRKLLSQLNGFLYYVKIEHTQCEFEM